MTDAERLARILETLWEQEDPGAYLGEACRLHPELADCLEPHRRAVALIQEALEAGVRADEGPPGTTAGDDEPPSLSGRLGPDSVAEGLEPGSPVAGETPTDPARSRKRLLVESLIGRGAMGEVYLVHDEDLRRRVAMKVMRAREGDAVLGRRSLFISEAQTTSQLEHPGVPPVHDLGTTPDGRLYFTMKLVQGRTLRKILHDLRVRRRSVLQEWNLSRLVTTLERVCETLHYAHERGVVHRDLKPGNIMLGDFGEVQVMDWGLARLLDADDGWDEEAGGRIETDRGAARLRTRHGTLKGTLPYMSPEQARGDVAAIDRRTDVYALGCVLYEVLTLTHAFEPSDPQLLEKKVRGEVRDVASRDPTRVVPTALAEICRQAMDPVPERRPPTALAVGEALRAWLDGTEALQRHREAADRHVEEGEEALARCQAIRERRAALGRERDAAAERVEPWRPRAEKRDVLDLDSRMAALDAEAERARVLAVHRLNAALTEEPGHRGARERLAALWEERLFASEKARDAGGAAEALAMVERLDDGRRAAVLRGDGTLTLSSEPAGARATLERYEDEGGRLRPGPPIPLGPTPILERTLPMGSYRVTLSLRGFRDVVYPVLVRRCLHWEGTVRMRTDEEIGTEFVYVPAGRFQWGFARMEVVLAAPERVIVRGDFAIQRHPVTNGEYARFLDALLVEEGEEAVRIHMPATPMEGAHLRRGDDGHFRVREGLLPPPAHARNLDLHGEGYPERLPVVGVSWLDAQAYCAWKSRATGREWRLPDEEEWEKATRGVDGRHFPWGDRDDPALANARGTHGDLLLPEPIGAHPGSVSPYGAHDLAGNTLEWCRNPPDGREDLRPLRGGTFHTSIEWSTMCRFGLVPVARFTDIGFRCAHGFETPLEEGP